MARVSEWLVRIADLAEAEADSLRLAVRREAKLAGATLRRWTFGAGLLVVGCALLAAAALLLVASVYTAFEPLVGSAGGAAIAAGTSFLLAGGCLWGSSLATRS